METDALPDSGGHYYDRDSGGVISVIERNAHTAVNELKSGDAGALAVGFTLSALFTHGVKRVITNG